MSKSIKIFFVGFATCSLMIFGGCVSLETQKEISIKDAFKPVRTGVYHKVKKDETLWRIAKAYHVTVSEIERANNIPKAAQIENNQLVFIPGAKIILNP